MPGTTDGCRSMRRWCAGVAPRHIVRERHAKTPKNARHAVAAHDGHVAVVLSFSHHQCTYAHTNDIASDTRAAMTCAAAGTVAGLCRLTLNECSICRTTHLLRAAAIPCGQCVRVLLDQQPRFLPTSTHVAQAMRLTTGVAHTVRPGLRPWS